MAGEPAAAWARLTSTLDELSALVEAEAGDEVERAEGYRHLARLFSICAEWHLEKADPDRPAFTRVITPWRKFIGDNPDTAYDVAPGRRWSHLRAVGHQVGAELYLGVTIYGRSADGTIEMLGQVADDRHGRLRTIRVATGSGIGGDEPEGSVSLAAPPRPCRVPVGAAVLPFARARSRRSASPSNGSVRSARPIPPPRHG